MAPADSELLGVSLLSLNPVLGDAVTVSGTVRDNSAAPVVGALVEAVDPMTTLVAGSDSTDATGYYTLSIQTGTYDIHVTPPAGSGFQPAESPGQVILADTVLNFVLVPSGIAALSGQVLDALGSPVANQYLNLYPAGGGSSTTRVTDALGNYTFQVAPGDYQISMGGANYEPTAAPRYYSMYTPSPFSLTQSITMNISLPARRVSVHVQDPGGMPVSGVGITSQFIDELRIDAGELPCLW